MDEIANDKYRTWIEISKSAVENNYRAFRKIIKPHTKLMGVVKSNAYGHGLIGFSKILNRLGADWFGVDSIMEADALRQAGIKKPILVLGSTLPENFSWAARKKIALTISSFENARILARKNLPLSIHIKIETGLNRQGFLVRDLPKLVALLKPSKHLEVQGLYTHFAKAYYPKDKNYTVKQITKFLAGAARFHGAGYQPMLHAAATGGTLNFPEAHFDMVRIGIGLYGLWPTAETEATYAKKIRFLPVLTWKTRINELKPAARGETVGYYRTERLKRNSKLAILPIGYWHGFDRRFSSRGQVLVRGKKARVMGRVSMDMSVVDVTDIPGAQVGDEAVLIGRQGGAQIGADDLAKTAQTINYEIVTRINPLIQKFYV